LQVDIFVTRIITPPARPRYNIPPPNTQSSQFSDIKLVPPTPSFAREAKAHRRQSAESTDGEDDDVDLSYYSENHSDWSRSEYRPARTEDEEAGDLTYGLDPDGHILDYTNFDGDDDQAMPGEEVLNQSVKKQGKIRRAKTRKASRATPAAMERLRERRKKSSLGHGEILSPSSESPLQDSRSHSVNPSHGSTASVDRLLSHATGPGGHTPERRLSIPLEVDLGSPTAAHSDSPWRSPSSSRVQTPAPMYLEAPESGQFSNWDAQSEIASTREMMMSHTGEQSNEMVLEVDERELLDVHVVSEHARPGKPKLDRILAEEVEKAKGSVIVACCGPTSLNALVRKIIAAKIDPGRIRRGDMRGMISLVSEEFEY